MRIDQRFAASVPEKVFGETKILALSAPGDVLSAVF
jgi:hypothetical protein